MVKRLVIFFMLAIVVLLGGCNENITYYEEEKEVVRKSFSQEGPFLNYYKIYFTDDDYVIIGAELYNKINVGDKVIVKFMRGEKDYEEVAGVEIYEEE